ncbi:hypothetical protein [Streptomyces sp. ICBB 8177]|uniref:hypothetical protein n=1 Tax=Streptomyces sp. ICBB 8177 TaxID=563922 RepID=UPI000D675376|nr:hypothetical protein [Streptomyces sp. ICBB 8177]PWI45370.1 hypothetical protein CK485_04325 [Streptomyces sp. ICBB 8177]
MLSPVDLPSVFAPDRIHGVLTDPFPGPRPGLIHSALGWWVGSCLVLTCRAGAVAVVHDGTEPAMRLADHFARGAANCLHYAATVSIIGEGDADLLAYGVRTVQGPGALITTDAGEVTMRLLAAGGTPMTCGTGLELICDLIARDRVPIPVNAGARGRILQRRDFAHHYATAEG